MNFAKFLRAPFFIEHLRWLKARLVTPGSKITVVSLEKIPLLVFRLAMNIAVNNSEGMNLKT